MVENISRGFEYDLSVTKELETSYVIALMISIIVSIWLQAKLWFFLLMTFSFCFTKRTELKLYHKANFSTKLNIFSE